MKKLIFCAVFAALVLGSVRGQEDSDPDNKKVSDFSYFARNSEYTKNVSSAEKDVWVKYFEGKKVYFLEGFQAGDYDYRTDRGLGPIVDAEIKAVKNGVKGGRVTPPGGKPYSIIGYSQGGLRALSYITRLEKQYGANSVNDIDAVITVSGINRGVSLLDGGLGAFKKRVEKRIDILGNGLLAVASAGLTFVPIIPSQAPLALRNKASKIVNTATDIMYWALPEESRSFFLEAWVSTNSQRVPQIRDMIPDSGYIRENVIESVVNVTKKKTGDKKLVTKWRTKKVNGKDRKYLWTGYEDVYAYYFTIEMDSRFNKNVPVGFIVGTDNDTLGMSNESKKIKEAIDTLKNVFGAAEGVHITKCIALVGLITGSVTYAADADKARKFCRNIKSELNTLKGSSANDGFVAVSDQYIPKTFTNPSTRKTQTILQNPVLRGGSKGYADFRLNHQNIVQKGETFREARDMVTAAEIERQKQGLTEITGSKHGMDFHTVP